MNITERLMSTSYSTMSPMPTEKHTAQLFNNMTVQNTPTDPTDDIPRLLYIVNYKKCMIRHVSDLLQIITYIF